MMWWYGDGMNGWGYALMTLSTVLFWALIVVGAIVLVRGYTRGARPEPPQLTAEQILAQRFARGEIDAVEYECRLDVLRGGVRPPARS